MKLIAAIWLGFLIWLNLFSEQKPTAKPNTYELKQCSIYRGQDESGNHYFIKCNREEPKEIETEYG